MIGLAAGDSTSLGVASLAFATPERLPGSSLGTNWETGLKTLVLAGLSFALFIVAGLERGVSGLVGPRWAWTTLTAGSRARGGAMPTLDDLLEALDDVLARVPSARPTRAANFGVAEAATDDATVV